MFTIKVSGVEENIARLKNVEIGLQNHEIGEVINYVCSIVANQAKAAAPVRTGRLRDSIVYYMNNELSGEVAAVAPYASAVEYGYTKKNGTRVPGANFFRPAAIMGGKLLKTELLKYTIAITKGEKVKPPTAPRTSGKGSTSHKYLYKMKVGGRTRYVYSKDSTTISSFRQRLKPSGRQQKFGFPTRYGGAQR